MNIKECGCKTIVSKCEQEGKECYLIFIDGYLECNKCGYHPNDLLNDLCEHDFILN